MPNSCDQLFLALKLSGGGPEKNKVLQPAQLGVIAGQITSFFTRVSAAAPPPPTSQPISLLEREERAGGLFCVCVRAISFKLHFFAQVNMK